MKTGKAMSFEIEKKTTPNSPISTSHSDSLEPALVSILDMNMDAISLNMGYLISPFTMSEVIDNQHMLC